MQIACRGGSSLKKCVGTLEACLHCSSVLRRRPNMAAGFSASWQIGLLLLLLLSLLLLLLLRPLLSRPLVVGSLSAFCFLFPAFGFLLQLSASAFFFCFVSVLAGRCWQLAAKASLSRRRVSFLWKRGGSSKATFCLCLWRAFIVVATVASDTKALSLQLPSFKPKNDSLSWLADCWAGWLANGASKRAAKRFAWSGIRRARGVRTAANRAAGQAWLAAGAQAGRLVQRRPRHYLGSPVAQQQWRCRLAGRPAKCVSQAHAWEARVFP